MTQDQQSKYPPPTQAWSMVAILFLAYTLSFVDRQIITLLVGPIRADLGFSLVYYMALRLLFSLQFWGCP